MTPERLQRIDEVFQSALELAPKQRLLFLAEIRQSDPELHAEVDSLLCAHDSAGAFIEAPAADAAAALLAATPLATHVGSYTIEAPLGAGGMGEVYRAVDRMGRRVALKTLAPRYVGDQRHVSRFLQEARAVLALNHPNVVTVYDIGEADGVYYIASELIEGETLREAVNNRALTLDALLDIATQAATGIAAAHEKGIVHRDVKPENVMVRADGYVKVLDFGIAKLTEAFHESNETAAQTALTREGIVIGTASYMSPEQARGSNVDARSDVWSLGVVLYEMVTGALPFPGDTAADVIGRILEREPAPLANLVDLPPDELQAIVARALTKDPHGRFQTMAEVIAALKALRQDLAFTAKLQRRDVPNGALIEITGPKPFVFVCYAHADLERVYPHIEHLRADGIEVWFDRGIRAGTVWRKVVTEALDRSTHVVFFVSRDSLESEHCDPEVQYALDKGKVVIPIFLERTELSPPLRVVLSRVHSLYCDQMSAETLRGALRDAILNEHSVLTTTAATGSGVGDTRRRRRALTGMAAAIVAIAIAALVWFVRTPHSPPLPTRSIAVLPFAVMSDDSQLRHLADALVEAVLNDLTSERQLRVASRTSSSNRPVGQSVSTFAAALRVSYVLEGSVRPTANGVRVTVQLIRGRDDVHLLSRTLDMTADGADVSGAAREIAAQVFRYVDNDAEIAWARTQTTNDEAFDYYQKVVRFDPSGEEIDTRAVGQEQSFMYLDKALALDPTFAEPYLQRALRVSWDQAGPLIDRYLQLQPASSKAWTMRGMAQVDKSDLAGAEKSLRHARELNPDDPWPLSQLGLLAARRGHLEEAADYLKQSTVNDHAKPSHYYYGGVLLNLRRFDEADQEFEIALRVIPTSVEAMVARVLVSHLRGNDAEAKARFDAAWAKYGATQAYAFIGVMPIVGREQDLRELMKRWDEGTPEYAVLRFYAHLALRENDDAIDWLIRSIDQGLAQYIGFIRSGAVLENLRAHPRFGEVLAKLDASEVTH